MKKAIYNLSLILALLSMASCENISKTENIERPYRFYKFFNPFTFKGIDEIDSTSLAYPYYKIYTDSLENILKIDKYLSNEEIYASLVKVKGNKHIIYSSKQEKYLTVNICLICDNKQVIKIHNYNFKETPAYTNFVSIFKPNSEVTYNYFRYDIPLDNKKDSMLLKKIVFVDPELLNIDTLHYKERISRSYENDMDSIKVVTKVEVGDIVTTKTKKFNKKTFDRFWLFQYNCNL